MNAQQYALALPLVAAVAVAVLQSVVIGLTRFGMVGTKKMTYDDFRPGQAHGPKWYGSFNRAYVNTLEALVLFAPAMLILIATGEDPGPAAAAAWVFVGARVAYTLIYVTMGYQLLVSLVWLVSLGAILVTWLPIVT